MKKNIFSFKLILNTLKFLIFSILFAFTINAFTQSLNIKGYVQFWIKKDFLPIPISDKFELNHIMHISEESSDIVVWSKILQQDNIFSSIKIYWSLSNPNNTYVVFQTKLWYKDTSNTNINIAECSYYLSDKDNIIFPAGACSGFLYRSEKDFKQIGISFFKK